MPKINKQQALVGATVAALAVTAYFMSTASGKKQKRKLEGWMLRMKGDVMDKLEGMKEVTEPVYREVVDTVAHAQTVKSKIPKAEILALAADLKRQWNTIQKMVGGSKAPSKRKTSRSTSRSRKSGGKKSSSSRSRAR